jgi:hypothetical protein
MSESTAAYWQEKKPGIKERNEGIVLMRDSGSTFPEIGKKYGIKTSEAHAIYHRTKSAKGEEPVRGLPPNYKLSEETKAKISLGGKGKPKSAETRARMSASLIGNNRGVRKKKNE